MEKIEEIITSDKKLSIDIINKIETLLNEPITDAKQLYINKILHNFINNSEKKYLNKTSNTDFTYYEYDNYYTLYIKNKKMDIIANFNILFPNKTPESITIDKVKLNTTNLNDILIDMREADSILIKILK
jgi:hypothetical protein